MTEGRLIAVVGPSGVGKDSVMEAMKEARPDLHLVRRVISRPSSSGGEAFEGVSEAEFTARVAQGEFALHWQAHGLSYGIPASIAARLSGGQDCLVNLSRAMLSVAQARFETLIVLNLTARPETLALRLQARGREDSDQIAKRLTRAAAPLPDGLRHVHQIENDSPLPQTVSEAISILYPVRA